MYGHASAPGGSAPQQASALKDLGLETKRVDKFGDKSTSPNACAQCGAVGAPTVTFKKCSKCSALRRHPKSSMLYLLNLVKDLDVHPKHFGKNLRDVIEAKLIDEVEGTCHGKFGYVVCVNKFNDIAKGKVRQDGSGFAVFKVSYMAIVCRPYKGEVLDCVVTSVNKMGFFAEAGPLQIFVSNHLIPEDYEYNAVGDPCYVSNEDGAQTLQERTEVRLRIVGTKMDQTEIFCIGTMKEDFLGVINPAP
ncbi:hypothetical protein FOA52_015826 [Chlamydomonas sp. UWO 241]|nr:hypothetical protein FOA52_015826 [Chlamydomonas sp. UWO 241]